jgi:hypothetical protein
MSELLKPPAVPAAILNFFASQPDFSAVAGDISEEFHQRAQNSGAKAAKRWYWREASRNALALTWRELMQTPVRTALVVLGCFLAANVAIDLYAFIRYYHLPGLNIINSERHRAANLVLNLIAYFATGWIGGRLLRGREWALALMFTVFSALLNLLGAWNLFFVQRASLPPSWRNFVIVLIALRLSAFWLGGLWIRVHSRSFAANSIVANTPQSSAPRNPPDPW